MRTAILLLMVCLCSLGAMAGTDLYPEPLTRLSDEFMHSFFNFQPSAATRAGLHEYDARLESFTPERVVQQKKLYGEYLRRLRALETKGWSRWALDDREMLSAFIESRILELEMHPQWRLNPDYYSSVMSDSTFLLMGRSFAPPEERLRSLVARERQMPRLLDEARQNLHNPPRVFTEIALEQLPGIEDFFAKDVPSAFTDVKDKKLLREFAESNTAVVNALKAYEAWMKRDLLPRSHGNFRLGEANFLRKLAVEEMVELPLERLRAVGEKNLRRNQREFQRVAKLLDASKTPAELLAEIEKEHPAGDQLLAAFRGTLEKIRGFADTNQIITTPSRNLPVLEETPPYMRAITFASMDAPGPFESKATEAYFNVTLPEKDWKPEQVEEHMAAFNWGVITSTAIHEVIPGHYEQYLWNAQVPSRIRQFLSLDLSNVGSTWGDSNVEGWAHYTEQMMLDEGYGRTAGVPEEKDTAFLKLRLGQLQDALLRNARYMVAIGLHTGQMSEAQAVEYFVREGYQTRANGVREVKRGTGNPTYLFYTLGKLQIIQLRKDWEAKQGHKMAPREFHDLFMRQGVAPVKVIRRALLGDDSPTL